MNYLRFKHIDIENEKVKQIIKISFEIFSKNDLEKASTNMIVQRAGISRGLLYHYFKDKQELFDYLVYYSVKVTIHDVDGCIDWSNGDIFSRIRQLAVSKLHTAMEYPYIFDFYRKYALKLSRETMAEYADDVSPGIEDKLFKQGLDLSLIKDGVDIDKMIAVVRYTMVGLSTELYRNVQSGNLLVDKEIIDKLDAYIQFFKDTFYKYKGGLQ
jgi:TetR/AcrR family transcriptional regulator